MYGKFVPLCSIYQALAKRSSSEGVYGLICWTGCHESFIRRAPTVIVVGRNTAGGWCLLSVQDIGRRRRFWWVVLLIRPFIVMPPAGRVGIVGGGGNSIWVLGAISVAILGGRV